MNFSKDVLDKERYHNKGETVDLVVNVGEEFYNIEMNNNKSVEFMERNIDYTGRIYGSRAELGGIYQYNTIIQININNFNFEGNKDVIQVYQYRDKEGGILTNKIKIIYIYLPLIKEKYYNKSELSELEKFLLVINEENKENIDSFLEEGKIMEEYRRDAEDTSRKSEVVGLYNKEQEDEFLFKAVTTRQYRDGLEQGIEKGIEQTKIEIVKNMIDQKLDDEIIIQVTNITKEELSRIKNI